MRTADSKTTEKRFFCIGLWLEKWIFYDNPKKKKYYAKPDQSLPSTSTSIRPNIHDSKIMLCIWWDQKSLVDSWWAAETWRFHYILGDRYRLQLIRLSRALREKRSEYEQKHKVILLYDNARPHVAKVVKKYLETLKCDVLPHPLRTLLLLITGCSKGCSKLPVHFFRRNRKLAPKLDCLQRRVIFSRWNSKIAWEMGKSSRQRQYFNWSVHSFCFEINAQKNGPN